MAAMLALGFLLLSLLAPLQQDRLQLRSQQGKQALESGRFEEAVSIYRELVQAVPNNPGLLMNLGMAQYLAGRPQEAVAQFQAAVRLQPQLTQAHLLLGTAALETGDSRTAVDALKSVVEAEPGHPDARLMLADALLDLDRPTEAVIHLRQAADRHPKNPAVWYRLGRTYELLSQRAFQSLQQSAPESVYWLALVGETLFQQQRYPNAFFFYRKALEAGTPLPGLHASLAQVYRSAGHPDWADVEEQKEQALGPLDCGTKPWQCEFRAGRFDRVVELAAQHETPEAQYWRTRAYNRLAMEALSRLGDLPPSPEAHELRAEIYFNQKRYRDSTQELQSALALAPQRTRLRRQLAESLFFSREHEAAQPLLRELLADQPDHPELNFLYGSSLLQTQRAEEAVPFLVRALKRAPDLLLAHSALALAYLQLGRSEEAIPHLNRALEVDEDGSLHYQLAQVYQRQGKIDEARQLLQKYQQIQRSHQAETASLEEQIKITAPNE